VVAACALVVCVLVPAGPASVAALLAAGVVLAAAAMPARRWLRDASLVVGCAAMVLAGVPLLGLRAMTEAPVPVWPEARESGRLYTPAGGAGLRSWLATGMFPRTVWQVGYLNLVHDVRLARTYAPVADRRLVEHLDEADRGPAQRWWLDTLSARWVVLERGPTPTGMEVARRRRGVWLYRNLQAVPVITVAASPPEPYRAWQGVGAVVVVTGGDNSVGARIATPRSGWAWVSVTPAAGWRWRLDGGTAQLQDGPGILQSIAVPAGSHVLEGRYRPPGLPLAGGVSAFSCLVLCYLGWAARRDMDTS